MARFVSGLRFVELVERLRLEDLGVQSLFLCESLQPCWC